MWPWCVWTLMWATNCRLWLSSLLSQPVLPSKPCRSTSAIIGKTYMAADQAGAFLHTIVVLEAYLLRKLDSGERLYPVEVAECIAMGFRHCKERVQNPVSHSSLNVFSLALLPCTFSKCIDAILVPLCLQNIHVLNYSNESLILPSSS